MSTIFHYTGSQANNNFNLFRKYWDAVLLVRLLGTGRRFHSLLPLCLSIRCPNLVL